jgi:hypothetical protein|nr:MAG TPA_asm: hypothetical protein [Caudoviricetes sp.]
MVDALTIAIGYCTGMLLYDVITNLLEWKFNFPNQSDDDSDNDDKGAYGW